MDIQRPEFAQRKRRRRIMIISSACLLFLGLVIWVARMEPSIPTIRRDAVWTGVVERGPLDVTVRGIGSLVPETVRWIVADTDGRVEMIHRLPGEVVEPDTVLLELHNPTLQQELSNARSQLLSSQASLENQRAAEEDQLLQMEFELTRLSADLENAVMDVQINRGLFEDGLIAERELLRSVSRESQLQEQTGILRQRVQRRREQIDRQLAPVLATIAQQEELVALRAEQVDRLTVRAGMNGVLQRLPLEPGQQVSRGQQLAQVADPMRLKAVVRISETQVRDIQIGQTAQIDTRFGVVDGVVSRVNPTVVDGMVDVDVQFTGNELPPGARVDLTVEGLVHLNRLTDVVFVQRPSIARENSTASLFVENGDGTLRRTHVQFGPASVRHIVVLEGLNPGDQVILSDMSDWQDREFLRIQ